MTVYRLIILAADIDGISALKGYKLRLWSMSEPDVSLDSSLQTNDPKCTSFFKFCILIYKAIYIYRTFKRAKAAFQQYISKKMRTEDNSEVKSNICAKKNKSKLNEKRDDTP